MQPKKFNFFISSKVPINAATTWLKYRSFYKNNKGYTFSRKSVSIWVRSNYIKYNLARLINLNNSFMVKVIIAILAVLLLKF